MPEMLKFDENMGSMDAHISLLSKRILEAEDNVQRVKERNLGSQALESAMADLEKRRQEFESFKENNNIEDGQEYIN